MAGLEDIRDPDFRSALEEAERLLNEGNYTLAARQCAETYCRLLERRPDMAPENPGPGGHPGGSRAMWPRTGGILLVLKPDQKPSLRYEKERFSFSEAATYFEFVLEELVKAQRPPLRTPD